MFAFFIATVLSPDWKPQVDPPALVTRIGSPAFRHVTDFLLLHASPDGKRVYTAEYSGCGWNSHIWRIFVWDAATGKQLNSYEPASKTKGETARCYRFATDGLHLLIRGHMDSKCQWRLHDPDTGRLIREGKPWEEPPLPRILPGPLSHVGGLASEKWVPYRSTKESLVLDVQTGKAIAFTPVIPADNTTIQISSDGRLALATLPVGERRLYDLPEGKLRSRWQDEGERQTVGFAGDGTSIVTWDHCKDGWVLELKEVDGKARTLLKTERGPEFVVFTPGGRAFGLLAPDETSWEIRDFATRKLLSTLPCKPFDPFPLFSKDGHTAWMSRREGRTLIPVEVATGQPVTRTPQLTSQVDRFRFAAEDNLVGVSAGFVISWDSNSGRELARVAVPRSIDTTLGSTFASGEMLVFTDTKGNIVSWNFRTNATQQTPVRPPDRKVEDFGAQVTPDGQFHVVRDGTLIIRDAVNGKTLIERTLPPKWTPRLSQWDTAILTASPDRKLLAVAPESYSAPLPVTLLDLTDPKAVTRVLDPDYRVNCLAISPDSRTLIAVGDKRIDGKYDLALSVWDLQTQKMLKLVPIPAWSVLSSRFAPDGMRLAIHCGDRVLILDTKTWEVQAKVWTGRHDYQTNLPRESQGDTLAWSPSGRLLVAETADERLAVWDVAKLTGK